MNKLLLEKDFIKIGFIAGLSGVNGFFKVVLDADFEDYFHKNLRFFYIKVDGMFVPYFIEERQMKNDPVLIKVEAFSSKEEAVVLTDREMYYRRNFIPQDLLTTLITNPERWDINGFFIVEQKGEKVIGKVLSMEEYPSGFMANVIDHSGQNFLVPLVEQFIIDIREDEQQIVMDLPEGIIPDEEE